MAACASPRDSVGAKMISTIVKLLILAVIAIVAIALVAAPEARADGGGAGGGKDGTADAKTVIAAQLELIKKGDVAALKAGFTARLQEHITDAAVKKAQGEVGKYTLDDLVASATMVAKGQLKVKMKNGRTLTTLVLDNGKWLADTIWFK
jgi:hypothetical protein